MTSFAVKIFNELLADRGNESDVLKIPVISSTCFERFLLKHSDINWGIVQKTTLLNIRQSINRHFKDKWKDVQHNN